MRWHNHGPSSERRGWSGTGRRAIPITAATVTAVLLLAASSLLLAQGAGAILRFGLSVSAIVDMNPNDAMAATLLFARSVGRASGMFSDAQISLYADSEAVVKAVNTGTVDIVSLSGLEFLALEPQIKADPAFTYLTSGDVTVEYVLVTREGINSVTDLARRRVAVYSPSSSPSLGRACLDVTLLEAGMGDSSGALQEVKPEKKKTQALMALFFGQVDAAVEPRSAVETAVEMNPQIGKKIRVIAKSAPLLPGVTCISRSMGQDVRRRYVERAATLHDTPAFRQSFLVMQITRVIAFEPRFLEATRQLNEKYLALRKSAGIR
jgi:ABC-type phosphate/phosphonate transport system substrate-binding protein